MSKVTTPRGLTTLIRKSFGGGEDVVLLEDQDNSYKLFSFPHLKFPRGKYTGVIKLRINLVSFWGPGDITSKVTRKNFKFPMEITVE